MAREDYAMSKQDAILPEEFGFHYPHNINEIRNATAVLEQFNQWPEEGGYFDQDAKLIDDILTYKRIKSWVDGQNKPKGDREDGGE